MTTVNAVLNPFIWGRPLDDPAKIVGWRGSRATSR